jgi:hypothetical protein
VSVNRATGAEVFPQGALKFLPEPGPLNCCTTTQPSQKTFFPESIEYILSVLFPFFKKFLYINELN